MATSVEVNIYLIHDIKHIKKTMRDLQAMLDALGDSETIITPMFRVTTLNPVVVKFLNSVQPNGMIGLRAAEAAQAEKSQVVKKSQTSPPAPPLKGRGVRAKGETISRECDWCGSIYEAQRKDSRFCCSQCGQKHRRASNKGKGAL